MLNPLSEEEEETRSLYSVIDKIRSDSGHPSWGSKVGKFRTEVVKSPEGWMTRILEPIYQQMAARSKTWVFGRSLTGIVGLNPTGCMDVCVVFVV